MIALLGAVIGLFGSFAPDLIGYLRAGQKLKHDLAVMEVQERMAAAGYDFQITKVNADADIREVEALHAEFAKRGETWKWMEALIQSVRPVLTYAFFGLYAAIKVNALLLALGAVDGNISLAMTVIWREEDQAIFSTIIAFWFGNRAAKHFRTGK